MRQYPIQLWSSGFLCSVLGAGLVLSPLSPAWANPIPSPHSSSIFMAQASPALTGSWRLVSMGEPASPMVPPAEIPLTLDVSGDRLAGSSGCNRYNGSYQAEGNQLTVSPLASTRMACPEPIMTQEMNYLAALQGAQRYEISDGYLRIFYETAQESGVLIFESQSVRALW